MNDFYVYVHRRQDTGMPFYVGKGKGARATVRQHRNPYWKRIVEKHGEPIVQFVVRGIDEELALLAEMELICKMRRVGVKLANMTDGGEGMSGYRRSAEAIERTASKLRGKKQPAISAALKGVPKSAAHRASLSTARTGVKRSAEVRAAMSARRKGCPGPMLGKKHTEASKQKTSAALRGDRNPFFGKTHSAGVIARIREANIGRVDSPETRARKSAARTGSKNPNFGRSVTDEQKRRQVASLKRRPLLSCPHCLRVIDEGNARRWHFDRCKGRK